MYSTCFLISSSLKFLTLVVEFKFPPPPTTCLPGVCMYISAGTVRAHVGNSIIYAATYFEYDVFF